MNRQDKSYNEQRLFSDGFIPYTYPILGEAFTHLASEFKDTKENIDLEIESAGIAFRVRRFSKRFYNDEFTMRSKLASRKDTELDKVIAGFGRYMLYATSNEKGDGFHSYSLMDLNVFRSVFFKKTQANQGKIPWKEYHNDDGSAMMSFKYKDFPRELVIAHKGLNFLNK